MTQVDLVIVTICEDEFEAVLQHIDQKPQKGPSGRTDRIPQVHAKTDQNEVKNESTSKQSKAPS